MSKELGDLKKTRILVGRTDRPTLEAVAAGLNQARPIQAHLDGIRTIPRRQRQQAADEAQTAISDSVGAMPQTDESEAALTKLQGLVKSGLLEVRTYPKEFLHARHTCAGTKATPNQAPPSSGHPTSPWPASSGTPS